MPVVAAALHSQVPAVAAAFKDRSPEARLAYVMTDGAGLPMAMSDLVATLRKRKLVDATITCGHAFGGDFEAVSVYSALAVARHVAHADAAVVAMGPGIVGTNTRLGFSGMEVGTILDAAYALGGVAIACLRVSFADPRRATRAVAPQRHRAAPRHRGTRAGGGPRAPRRRQAARLAEDLRDAGSTGGTTWSSSTPHDTLELLARHHLGCSRWGGPRPTTPRCSRPPPPPARWRRSMSMAERVDG